MRDDGHGPLGVVESREKDFLSHELQGDRLLTPSRLEKKTAGNQRERIRTSRNEPAAQMAKALVDRQVRFPAAPPKTCCRSDGEHAGTQCSEVVPAADPVPTVRCRNVIPVTIGDSTIMSEAFFTVDGDSYLPSVMARGPWGAAMGGQIVGGLLGWGIEQSGVDPDLQPARLTVDLLRPALLEPVQIQTSVQREGRRIKLVDGALVQNGKTVARASALFLRRGEHPDGEVWTTPVRMPPLPTDSDEFPADMPFFIWGYGANHEKGTRDMTEWEQSHAQKFAWTRVFRPIVQGHPLTPFSRLAFIGDITSSLTHWGTGGLRYINADYTVTASRLPDGEYLGLAAQSHYGTAGVATGGATLFDRHGPIGTSSALALAQSADAFNPSFTTQV